MNVGGGCGGGDRYTFCYICIYAFFSFIYGYLTSVKLANLLKLSISSSKKVNASLIFFFFVKFAKDWVARDTVSFMFFRLQDMFQNKIVNSGDVKSSKT